LTEAEKWALSSKAVGEVLFQLQRLPRGLVVEVAKALVEAGDREGSREGALLAERAEELLRDSAAPDG
jgi:hypothetical protein